MSMPLTTQLGTGGTGVGTEVMSLDFVLLTVQLHLSLLQVACF